MRSTSSVVQGQLLSAQSALLLAAASPATTRPTPPSLRRERHFAGEEAPPSPVSCRRLPKRAANNPAADTFEPGLGASLAVGSDAAEKDEEKDLPVRIWRAQQRVMSFTSGRFANLTLTDKAMLCEILRAVPQHRPAQPFSIRRSSLEDRLGISSATATRWLARLRDQGWIEREQVLSRAHGFQVSTMKLTDEAIQSLALRQAASLFLRESPVSHPEESSEQSSTKRQSADAGALDGSAEEVGSMGDVTPAAMQRAGAAGTRNDQGFEERSSDQRVTTAPAGVTMASAIGAARRLATPTIPEALLPLSAVLTPVQICFLMRRARAFGHRLEDVTIPCFKAICAATRPLPYILRLLRLPRDWAATRERMATHAVTPEHAHPIALVERREGEERQEFLRRKRQAAAVEVAALKADVLRTHAGKVFAPAGSSSRGSTDVIWRVCSWGIERVWRQGTALTRGIERDSVSFLKSLETQLEVVSPREADALMRDAADFFGRRDDAADAPGSTSLPDKPADAPADARTRAKLALVSVRAQLKARQFS